MDQLTPQFGHLKLDIPNADNQLKMDQMEMFIFIMIQQSEKFKSNRIIINFQKIIFFNLYF